MKKYLLGSIAFVFLVSACSEDDDQNKPPETSGPKAIEYYPMNKGNYWVYDRIRIDTNGVETKTGQDSVYIAGDTLINGKKYYRQESIHVNSLMERILRDSSGYLVNEKGNILFAPNDFSNPLSAEAFDFGGNDTTYTEKRIMQQNKKQIPVPAGQFEALEVKRDYTIFTSSPPTQRSYSTYRARNVGLVLYQNGTVNSPIDFEYRLVKYNIQK